MGVGDSFSLRVCSLDRSRSFVQVEFWILPISDSGCPQSWLASTIFIHKICLYTAFCFGYWAIYTGIGNC